MQTPQDKGHFVSYDFPLTPVLTTCYEFFASTMCASLFQPDDLDLFASDLPYHHPQGTIRDPDWPVEGAEDLEDAEYTIPATPFRLPILAYRLASPSPMPQAGLDYNALTADLPVIDNSRILYDQAADAVPVTYAREANPHVCTACGKGFKLAKTLKVHSQTIHQRHDIICRTCNQAFKRQDIYLRHQREQHGNEAGTVECTQCGKHVRPRVLAGHMSSKACRSAKLCRNKGRTGELALGRLGLATSGASPAPTFSSLLAAMDPYVIALKLFDSCTRGALRQTGVNKYEDTAWPIWDLCPSSPSWDALVRYDLTLQTLRYTISRISEDALVLSQLWVVTKILAMIDICLFGPASAAKHESGGRALERRWRQAAMGECVMVLGDDVLYGHERVPCILDVGTEVRLGLLQVRGYITVGIVRRLDDKPHTGHFWRLGYRIHSFKTMALAYA